MVKIRKMLKLKIRIIGAAIQFLIGAIIFSGGIRLFDIVYLLYFSPDYLSYDLPITSKETVYKSCETITLVFHRKSQIQTKIVSYTELINLDTNTKVIRPARTGQVPAVDEIVRASLDLGCQPEGNYQITGVFEYSIRQIDKRFYWYSESFKIESI